MKRKTLRPLDYSLLVKALNGVSPRRVCAALRSRFAIPAAIHRRADSVWICRSSSEEIECRATPRDELFELQAHVTGPSNAADAVLLLARIAASFASLGCRVFDTAEEREFEAEAYLAKNFTELDPRQHITVYGMEDFAPQVAWVRTRGLVKFCRPELELYCSPAEEWRAAGLRLMSAALYLIRENRSFKSGDTISIPEAGDRLQVCEAEMHAWRTPADPPSLKLRPVTTGPGGVNKFRLLSGTESTTARAAACAHMEGRVADAEREYRSVLARDPADVHVLNNLGYLLITTGRAEDAFPLLDHALELDARFAVAVNNLGNAHLAMGRADEAAEQYRRAAKLAPRDPLPHRNLGLALSLKGDIEGAIAAHQRYLGMLPPDASDAEAHYNLATLLSQKGADADVVAQLERALAIRRAFPRALNNLGLLHHQRGGLNSAAALYREALQFNPSFTIARFNLAMVHAAQGGLTEAIAELETVLRQAPGHTQAANNLAALYTRIGRAAEAVELLRKLAAESPSSGTIHFNYAQACEAAGDRERAAAEYEFVASLEGPDTVRGRRARAELEHLAQ